MKLVRCAFQIFMIGLLWGAISYLGVLTLIAIPLLLILWVYLEVEYFDARENNKLTFWTLRSSDEQIRELKRLLENMEDD